jgi:hypothetical protein
MLTKRFEIGTMRQGRYNLRDSIASFFDSNPKAEATRGVNGLQFEYNVFKDMIDVSYNPLRLEKNVSNIPPEAAKKISGFFKTAYTIAQIKQADDWQDSFRTLNTSIDDIFKADAKIQQLGASLQIPPALALDCRNFLETAASFSLGEQADYVAKAVKDLETKAAESGFTPSAAILTYCENIKNKFPYNFGYALHLINSGNKESIGLPKANDLLNIIIYYNSEASDSVRKYLTKLAKTNHNCKLELEEKVQKAVPELLEGMYFVKRAGRDGVYIPSLGAVRPAADQCGYEIRDYKIRLVNLDKNEEPIDKIPTPAGDVYLEWHPKEAVNRILGRIVAIYTENGRKITR